MRSLHLQGLLDSCRFLLGFSLAGTFCQFKCGALELYLAYSRRIRETEKRIALQLTLVPMVNLTAVVFTSVLGIARKSLYKKGITVFTIFIWGGILSDKRSEIYFYGDA